MKKKIFCITLSAALLLSSLTSCGKAVKTKEADGYAYTQELQVIEDNYRNYYEIFVASYYDSDGDGMGDFAGITEKLDYIKDMGFNGIWLMPIMPSPSYHKYDTTDYMDVDPAYGTIEDFKNLVDACHEKDIRIIVDFVVNHSSNEHPWFKEAYAYLQSLGEGEEPDANVCPYVDYYHFSRDKGGSGYSDVTGTPYKYESVFYYTQPDLNWENPAVRAEFEPIMDFWVKEIGIDGFRVDAAMHFEEDDTAFNTEVLSWMYQYCKKLNPEFYMVSEVWASKATVADYYMSQTDSMFNFDAGQAEGKILKAARGGNAENFVNAMLEYDKMCRDIYADYIDAPFLTNHDMGRVANALVSKEENMKMAGALLLSMKGSPFVYYGEEIGMKSSGNADENKRLPMIWSETDETGKTNGPVGSDKNVKQSFPALDEQQQDMDSINQFYKRALRIRNENPEIARGHMKKVDGLCNSDYATITKEYDESTIGVIYNTSAEEQVIDLSGSVLEDMHIRGYLVATDGEVTLEGNTVTMPAQSICYLK